MNELCHSIDVEEEASPIDFCVDRVAGPDFKAVSLDFLGLGSVKESWESSDLLEVALDQRIFADRGHETGQNFLVLGVRNVVQVDLKVKRNCDFSWRAIIVERSEVVGLWDPFKGEESTFVPCSLAVDLLDFHSGIVESSPLLPALMHGSSRVESVDEGLIGSVELDAEVVAQEKFFLARPGFCVLRCAPLPASLPASEAAAVSLASS